MKIPVTIVTGFLGAGKTTIIKSLLAQLDEQKLFVIVNEFGQVSIDAPLIKEQTGTSQVEIAEVNGSLVGYSDDDTFDELLNSIASLGSEIDHVVIETSGLAVPTAVCERLANCSNQFALDAVIAVVDAAQVIAPDSRSSAVESVFLSQLQCADICVLNKIDQMNASDLVAAETGLRKMAPTLRFVETAKHGKVASRLLLGVHLHATKQMQAIGAATGKGWNEQQHSHEGWSAHEHGLHTHEHVHEHDPGWLSFSLHAHDSQDESVLLTALDEIVKAEPVFRVKGFVNTTGNFRKEFQCVGQRIQVGENVLGGNEHEESELVFIGYNIERNKIGQCISRITKSEWH